jgi:hypothetical protein
VSRKEPAAPENGPPERAPLESLCRELERRGVAVGFARAAAEALMPFVEELAPEQWDGVLAGVTVAFGVHRRAAEAFRKTANDLDEVQRLLSSFGGELRKLDEALEILAAYAARLRTQTATPHRTLH